MSGSRSPLLQNYANTIHFFSKSSFFFVLCLPRIGLLTFLHLHFFYPFINCIFIFMSCLNRGAEQIDWLQRQKTDSTKKGPEINEKGSKKGPEIITLTSSFHSMFSNSSISQSTHNHISYLFPTSILAIISRNSQKYCILLLFYPVHMF